MSVSWKGSPHACAVQHAKPYVPCGMPVWTMAIVETIVHNVHCKELHMFCQEIYSILGTVTLPLCTWHQDYLRALIAIWLGTWVMQQSHMIPIDTSDVAMTNMTVTTVWMSATAISAASTVCSCTRHEPCANAATHCCIQTQQKVHTIASCTGYHKCIQPHCIDCHNLAWCNIHGYGTVKVACGLTPS